MIDTLKYFWQIGFGLMLFFFFLRKIIIARHGYKFFPFATLFYDWGSMNKIIADSGKKLKIWLIMINWSILFFQIMASILLLWYLFANDLL